MRTTLANTAYRAPRNHTVTVYPPSRSYLASPVGRLRTLLRAHGIRLKKSLGQHFLVDEDALAAILAAAEIVPGRRIVEVGPGAGIVTERLLDAGADVVAVDLDPTLVPLLRERFAEHPGFRLLTGDILATPRQELVGDVSEYDVVANLPYYITAAVLRYFLDRPPRPRRMVVMVQKEVAQRLVAPPGQLSVLGISVQLYGKPRIVRLVPASSFYPLPKVDSAIVRIDLYEEPAVPLPDVDAFFELVHAGFSQPRKQLHNALAQRLWFPPGGAIALLEAAGIRPDRRAQTLTLEEWARLAAVRAEQRG
jgi:16S rRNA (adenine1518-N6/adenine1519-N6)-dimethyltransferase